MRRNILTAMVLVAVVGLLAAPAAEAGMLDKWHKKDEKKSRTTQRYDLYPTMGFYTGTLGRGIGTEWTLDGYRLILAKDCTITNEADDSGLLDEGRQALVMGPRVGDTIVAWRVRVKTSEYGQWTQDSGVDFTPSEVDPTVGEGTGPE